MRYFMVKNQSLRTIIAVALAVVSIVAASRPAVAEDASASRPFRDAKFTGGPQKIPGAVQCAYYDLGGEGVAYHDTEPKNLGSGTLNPDDGSYLNEFRMAEGVDTSYTKFRDAIDNNPFNLVEPAEGMLYVGWTSPGEWFNVTVDVAETAQYQVDLLYTSNGGGSIALELNGNPLSGPLKIVSTNDPHDPLSWRQWHHWSKMRNLAEVRLPQGRNVLTVRILTEGNMNLATLDFHRAK
jgi:hypothetical protein